MSDGISDDQVSDWGSDFDEDVEDPNSSAQNGGPTDIYEVPDGKPSVPVPTVVPPWLRKASSSSTLSSLASTSSRSSDSGSSSAAGSSASSEADENSKPPSEVYIEHVLLPTRISKEEDTSKNFIETLKRKLSQKNLLAGMKNYEASKSSPAISSPTTPVVGSIVPNTDAADLKKTRESLQRFPWFYRVDRSKAELILENYQSDGCYLVRECHHGGPNVPFTLTLRFQGRLFHIQIRQRSDSHFALGTLKRNEMHFATVVEMIDTYKKTPLQLHSNGKYFGETKLTQPPIVYSYSSSDKRTTSQYLTNEVRV